MAISLVFTADPLSREKFGLLFNIKTNSRIGSIIVLGVLAFFNASLCISIPCVTKVMWHSVKTTREAAMKGKRKHRSPPIKYTVAITTAFESFCCLLMVISSLLTLVTFLNNDKSAYEICQTLLYIMVAANACLHPVINMVLNKQWKTDRACLCLNQLAQNARN